MNKALVVAGFVALLALLIYGIYWVFIQTAVHPPDLNEGLLCESDFNWTNECVPNPSCASRSSEYAYYDGTRANESGIENSTSTPAEIAAASVAIYHRDGCACTRDYKIKGNNGWNYVSCEVFYRKISDENASCNGCISIWGSG